MLEARHALQPVVGRSAIDRTSADAMRNLMKRYPDDLNAATISAEAAMDTVS